MYTIYYHNIYLYTQVVKSRFQSEVTIPGQSRKYKYTLPSLATIYREEGLSAVYKGFRPKAIRLVIQRMYRVYACDMLLSV